MKRKRQVEAFQWPDSDGEQDEPAIEQESFNHMHETSVAQVNSLKTMGRVVRPQSIPEPAAPSVFLMDQYNTTYNTYMNGKFKHLDEEGGAGAGGGESEEPVVPDNLFSSLFPPGGGGGGGSSPPARGYDTTTRPECFLCAWGNKFHDGIEAHHVNRLNDILENYGGCANIELAEQLHLYYEHYVYKPGGGMAMLTRHGALEHIEGMHSLSAKIFLGESIRRWKAIIFNLENIIFKANGKYDRGAVADCEKAQKILDTLYLMDPDKMNFSMGKSREDTVKMGQHFNFMPIFKQQKERRQRVEKKRDESVGEEFDV